MTPYPPDNPGDTLPTPGWSIAGVCFSRTVGGLELATLRRCGELADRGYDVVAVLPDSEGLLSRAADMGLKTRVLAPRLPYADPVAARKLRRVLCEHSVEQLLVARTRDLSTSMLAAGPARSVVLYQQMQSGLNKRDWFHDRVFSRLDGCIAITELGRRELLATTVLTPDRVETIPYPIDSSHFSPAAISRHDARRRLGFPEDSFVVGIVGGFNPGKGQREFLEAVRLACDEEPALLTKLGALLVGLRPDDSGAYAAELERLRQSLPIADRVVFRPFADDTRPAYAALDVFVLASYCETFGMVLQEAMAMQVATVGTDCGGVPEIVRDGETGMLVPPKDPEAIASTIVRLFRDRPLRERLAAAGREFVARQYDPIVHGRRFEAALARFRRGVGART